MAEPARQLSNIGSSGGNIVDLEAVRRQRELRNGRELQQRLRETRREKNQQDQPDGGAEMTEPEKSHAPLPRQTLEKDTAKRMREGAPMEGLPTTDTGYQPMSLAPGAAQPKAPGGSGGAGTQGQQEQPEEANQTGRPAYSPYKAFGQQASQTGAKTTTEDSKALGEKKEREISSPADEQRSESTPATTAGEAEKKEEGSASQEEKEKERKLEAEKKEDKDKSKEKTKKEEKPPAKEKIGIVGKVLFAFLILLCVLIDGLSLVTGEISSVIDWTFDATIWLATAMTILMVTGNITDAIIGRRGAISSMKTIAEFIPLVGLLPLHTAITIVLYLDMQYDILNLAKKVKGGAEKAGKFSKKIKNIGSAKYK